MRIIMFRGYYEPEIAASMFLDVDTAEGLAELGHEVDLHVPAPTRGVSLQMHRQYSGKTVQKVEGRLRVHYFHLYREGKSPLQRLVRYLLLNAIQFFIGLSSKADVIYSGSTPPTMGAMCALLHLFKHIPYVYNIQDVFPDSLVSTGLAVQGSRIVRLGEKLSEFSYQHANRIIVISEDCKKNLLARGIDEEKLTVVHNWVKTDILRHVPRENNTLFDELHVPRDCFIVIYAGNVGAAQGVGALIQAASSLQKVQNLRFVIIGDGSELDDVKNKAQGLPKGFVTFAPMQPYDRVSEVYSMGNIAVVMCKRGLGSSAMPSKTWSIMATGTPVLACFDQGTELEYIIKKSDCGVLVQADDVQAIRDAVLNMIQNSENLESMGKRGQHFVQQYLTKGSAMAKINNLLLTTQKERIMA